MVLFEGNNMNKFILFCIIIFIIDFFLQFTIFRMFENDILKIAVVAIVNGLIAFITLRKIRNERDE